MILDIVTYPDPRLKEVCEPVAEVTADIRQLAADMLETMYAAPGVGLAAPQVTYIMHDLRQNGLQVGNDVTTVEEAADEIMRYFRGKHPEETKL